jgi:hypothetical protein
LNFQATDIIVVFKSYTDNLDLSDITTAADKIICIKNNTIEYLSTTELILPHTITINSDEFIYKLRHSSAQADMMIKRACEWNKGDTFIFENIDLTNQTVATDTPWLSWQDTNYRSASTYDIMQTDSIAIDGELYDSGWRSGGWYNVDSHNGHYTTNSEGLTYNYKIKTDENYLYLGFINPIQGLTLSGAEEIAVLRIWIRTNKNATVYTHCYGFSYLPGTGLVFDAKSNSSLTDNLPVVITNSGAFGAYKNSTDKI